MQVKSTTKNSNPNDGLTWFGLQNFATTEPEDPPVDDPVDALPPQDPPKDPPKSSRGGGAKSTVDDERKKLEEEKARQEEEQAKLNATASALNWLDKELPTLMADGKVSETAKVLIDRYNGDKNDHVAREVWAKESIITDYFASLSPEQKEAMPKLYQTKVSSMKSGYGKDDIATLSELYAIMIETQELHAKAEHTQKMLDAGKTLQGLLSENDLKRLSEPQKREYHARIAGQTARQARAKAREAQKGGA